MAIMTPITAPITTTHPAITVITSGINGTVSVWPIIPKPTASETSTPTIQATIPIKPAFDIFPPFVFSYFFVLAITWSVPIAKTKEIMIRIK